MPSDYPPNYNVFRVHAEMTKPDTIVSFFNGVAHALSNMLRLSAKLLMLRRKLRDFKLVEDSITVR